jgi:hypothetical protein
VELVLAGVVTTPEVVLVVLEAVAPVLGVAAVVSAGLAVVPAMVGALLAAVVLAAAVNAA